MYKEELVKSLHISHKKVNDAMLKAAEKCTSLKRKYMNGCIDMDKAELNLVLDELNVSKLQRIFINENYKEKNPDSYRIKGTLDFLEKFKSNPHIKCCNTCKYLKGYKLNSSIAKPYCAVYESLLSKFNAKVYEDWCSSYEYNGLDKPKMWFKENAPTNIDQFGNFNTIGGLDSSNFKTGKRGEKVKIVGQVGFDFNIDTDNTQLSDI